MVVYILNSEGRALMPTKRCNRVRMLLKEKKAIVVRKSPFTIQLLYETTEFTQPIRLGIDAGRTNIGLCAVREDGTSLLTVQVETRNKEVPKLMADRKAYRQQHRKLKRRDKRRRRARSAKTVSKETPILRLLPQCDEPIVCHDIKNKEAKFNNRRRPSGWLIPTASHLLQTHVRLVDIICSLLPITDIVIELNRFAFMAMDNPNIQKWQYQRGKLYKKKSKESAISEMQEEHCIFCKQAIEHYHHIVPKHKGGSNTIDNIAGLCTKHHDLVHKEQEWTTKLANKKAGLNKKYGALSVLNQIIPYFLNEMEAKFPSHCYVITGRDTKQYREDNQIRKDHYLDAYCIASSTMATKPLPPNKKDLHLIKQFRRHDRQCCHKQMVNRNYYLENKLVATNRHKAIEQKSDSLEEFRVKLNELYTSIEVSRILSKLKVKEHHPQYKDRERMMPGSMFLYNGKPYVLHHSDGRHNGLPDYYIDTDGNKHRANRCIFIKNNTGIVWL